VLGTGVEGAILRLVAVTEQLRCVRLLQGRVSNRDSARIRIMVPLTSSSERPPRHDEQMPMECGRGSRDIKNYQEAGKLPALWLSHGSTAGVNVCAYRGSMPLDVCTAGR
jgi:hypothetical protein